MYFCFIKSLIFGTNSMFYTISETIEKTTNVSLFEETSKKKTPTESESGGTTASNNLGEISASKTHSDVESNTALPLGMNQLTLHYTKDPIKHTHLRAYM